MKIKNLILLIATLLIGVNSWAQTDNIGRYVTIQMTPDHHDWVYKIGEQVEFDVAVIKNSYAQENIDVEYQWGEETLTPTLEATLNTGKTGHKTLKLKGLKKAGFMTLMASVTVDGKKYTNYINVGFEPEKIETVVEMPSDFKEFWSKVIDDNSKVPLEPIMTLKQDQCTPTTNVYHIRFQNTPNTYIYGMLSVPKAEGNYPAVLIVPGAGVRAYYGTETYTKQDVISLSIGIHGIPVDMNDEFYTILRAGALAGYYCFNYDDRDKHYYKRVFAGCVKAVDFLCSLDNVDKDRIGVFGGSQGGLFSMVVGALDPRIKCLVVNHPAHCNLSGYARGSISGWPKLFRNPDETNLKTKIEVSEYYDGVNFARLLDKPLRFGIGYNDRTCAPTSTYSVYNAITAPKQIHITNDCAHWFFPEDKEQQVDWIVEQLKK